MLIDLYLVRHATPDPARTDIPYDVPPGPPLGAVGEAEARALGEFLRGAGIVQVVASPFARAERTARIAASAMGLEVELQPALGEWHADERARDVVARVEPVLADVRVRSLQAGPICLVSHGGTIGVMLRKLGMARERVDAFRARYGGATPSPPAGVWRVSGAPSSPLGHATLAYELVFTPD